MKQTHSRKDPFQDCPPEFSIQPGMWVKFIKGIYLKKSDPLEFINGSVVMERSHVGPHVDGKIYTVSSCAEKDTGIFLVLQDCLLRHTIAVNRNLIGYFQCEMHIVRTISPIEKKRKSECDDVSSVSWSSLSVSSFTREQGISGSQKCDTEEVDFVEEDLSLSHDSKGILFFRQKQLTNCDSQVTTTSSSTTVGEEWRRAVNGFEIETDK